MDSHHSVVRELPSSSLLLAVPYLSRFLGHRWTSDQLIRVTERTRDLLPGMQPLLVSPGSSIQGSSGAWLLRLDGVACHTPHSPAGIDQRGRQLAKLFQNYLIQVSNDVL